MSPAIVEAAAKPLSKQKFLAGRQCHKQLWWLVHEPEAPELRLDAETQAQIAQGTHVGEVAREHIPGGTLIRSPDFASAQRVRETRNALDSDVPVIYEGSFVANGAVTKCDILRRTPEGFDLIEVKSATKVKDEYLPDVAFQYAVLRANALPVAQAFLMHLNRECRYPDLSNLFVAEDVTDRITPLAEEVPAQLAAQHAMLRGDLPDRDVGPHCEEPRRCAFWDRCWPTLPEHHVRTLYRIQRRTVEKHLANGIVTIDQLEESVTTLGPAQRQIRAVRTGQRVVEPGLRAALAILVEPVAHLDFETVALPIPRWPGCRPYDQVPVQFSVHFVQDGHVEARGWLASGPEDPRPALAAALVQACAGARTVVAYFSSFEAQCLEQLALAVPEHASALRGISARLVDLLPIVRDHVYDRAFGGSFSLKSVLPALVSLGYGDLAIQQGGLASLELSRLLFTTLDDQERARLRTDLLAYCERDTEAMVRLAEALGTMAHTPPIIFPA